MDQTHGTSIDARMDTGIEGAHAIRWEIDVPLLSNRIMVGGVARGFGLAALLMGSLLTFLLAVQGEFDAIGPIWLLTLAVCGGLLVVAVLVMLLVFRNRMRFRFTVDDDSVLAEQIDTTARAANRLAVVVGALSGSMGGTGSGLIAASQEVQRVDFRGAFRMQALPRSRVIVFRNGWRRLLYVYCTSENYAEVTERVSSAMRGHGTASRVSGRSPLPRYLGYSVLVVLASLPAFLTVEAFDVSLLIPLLMMSFALAMVWLLGVFGWVVIGSAVVQIGAVAADALSLHESYFEPGTSYSRWTVYSGDDWALLSLTALGLGVLCWLSVRAITGRLRSALASDEADMAGK